ncbi:hypothetical protein HPB48_008451 [Haemaphysalis longicornis]|uniref:Cytochrome P450 n=1 Tax=Haemaphysalis longicornis TaxID=44386 RepID=A0A9J6H1C1_HAELO|nr:hypothetical protein HPB48_008451 [Haemaphysalis longicornis]
MLYLFAQGQFFPKGVSIMAPTWHLHHDPTVWPDPFVFRPERFDPDESGDGLLQHHPGAYLPFGLGPRICIGKRFALLELKMAVCRILRQYRVVRCPQTQEPLKLMVQSVIINPVGGVVVGLERRQIKTEPAATSEIPGMSSARSDYGTLPFLVVSAEESLVKTPVKNGAKKSQPV